ncbi:MAG: exodeoxyribonuclease VII large subunit, partial [Rhodococcus sp. (in: high G+C Gram-positive bacteria)]
LEHMRARLSTLGPAATLARGYAVVQRVVPGGTPEVVRSLGEMPIGTQLRVRVADGAARAAVMGHEK